MTAGGAGSWLVCCLCAGWCTTCGAYTAAFTEVARQHRDAVFMWVDIETHADVLGDAALDIENFPTVLLMQGADVRFYGTVLPHAATLERLLTAAAAGALAPGAHCPRELAEGVRQLARRLPRLT